MGYPRCTRCTKFAKQKRRVNQLQKAKGIDERTFCVPCAKELYDDFVGLQCEHANCTTAPRGGEYKVERTESFARGILIEDNGQ